MNNGYYHALVFNVMQISVISHVILVELDFIYIPFSLLLSVFQYHTHHPYQPLARKQTKYLTMSQKMSNGSTLTLTLFRFLTYISLRNGICFSSKIKTNIYIG